MMAAILNSAMLYSDTAILDSDTLLSSLRFTQKHSHSILTLTQTNSIWLKLIHSHFTWWWQPSLIWPSWIQTPCYLLSDSLKKHSHSTLTLTQINSIWLTWRWKMEAIRNSAILYLANLHKKTWLIHLHLTWWWQPSWILPCWIETLSSWIQTPCYLLSDSLKSTLTPFWLWFKLIQSDSNSFIIT